MVRRKFMKFKLTISVYADNEEYLEKVRESFKKITKENPSDYADIYHRITRI